ncbi:MAG: hypothetical protein K9I47_08340 [Bacteroidales bacterium]|nr:hypothetical protein [Bacteroidales bacterium]
MMKNIPMLQYLCKSKYHLIFGLVFLLTMEAFSQKTEREKLAPFLDELQEEISFHTDRTLYVSGEAVWFNAQYLINGAKAANQISKVLYVELFNEKDETVVKKKFRIEGCNVRGMFEIPGDAATGNYVLRAYTKYQRNFSPYSYAYSYLIVFNPESSPRNQVKNEKPALTVFPEGGVAKPGQGNRFAININRPSTLDSLVVSNQQDSVIRRLNFFANGLAQVTLKHQDSLNYRLKGYMQNGEVVVEAFPKPDPDGYGLYARIKEDALHYQVKGSGDKETGLQVGLYSPALRKLYEEAPSRRPWKGKIAPENLKQGLNFLLLKDDTDKVLTVRTLYYFGTTGEKPYVELDSDTLKPREKVEMVLKPENNTPEDFMDVSVAVTRRGTGSNHRNTLYPHVAANPWLLKDFLSRQQNPRQFKKQIEPALMLFDRRVRDSFLNALENKTTSPEYLPEIKDVTVSGMVRNKETGRPVSGVEVYGSVLFNNPQFHIHKTNQKGEFIFTLNELNGLQDIFLSPVRGRQEVKNFEILINRDFDPRLPEFVTTPFPFDKSDKSFLEEININYQLNLAFNTTIDNGREEEKDRRRYYLFGKERLSRFLDRYIELDDMWDVLYEVVPHVKPVKEKDGYRLKIMDDESRVLPGNPLILLDNVPIFDINKIMKLHPSQVEKIEVIDRTYLLGSYAINGVMLITTKTDNFGGTSFPEASVFAEYLTLAKKLKFHNTTHVASGDKSSPGQPDFRNLLYWNPGIQLSEEPASVSFFTSDKKGKYDILIRGTGKTGRPVYMEKTITVG